MSIQEHLNKIRNAIKGSEVRESIAKGIETAYDDASEKDNANMEVKIARGTHPNLRSRLEGVDNKQQQTTTQLAQTDSKKVDRDGVGQVTWSNISQDAREQISGDKVAVVGKDSVGTENIIDNSVTTEKASFIKPDTSFNLFDGNYSTSLYVAGGTGYFSLVSDLSVKPKTAIINVKPNTTYTVLLDGQDLLKIMSFIEKPDLTKLPLESTGQFELSRGNASKETFETGPQDNWLAVTTGSHTDVGRYMEFLEGFYPDSEPLNSDKSYPKEIPELVNYSNEEIHEILKKHRPSEGTVTLPSLKFGEFEEGTTYIDLENPDQVQIFPSHHYYPNGSLGNSDEYTAYEVKVEVTGKYKIIGTMLHVHHYSGPPSTDNYIGTYERASTIDVDVSTGDYLALTLFGSNRPLIEYQSPYGKVKIPSLRISEENIPGLKFEETTENIDINNYLVEVLEGQYYSSHGALSLPSPTYDAWGFLLPKGKYRISGNMLRTHTFAGDTHGTNTVVETYHPNSSNQVVFEIIREGYVGVNMFAGNTPSLERIIQTDNFRLNNLITDDGSTGVVATEDQMYLQHTVSGNLSQFIIYQPAPKAGDHIYLGTRFFKRTNERINADVYQLGHVKVYEKFGETFEEIEDSMLVLSGEWEMAVKEQGMDDFMGGTAHGDEVMFNFEIFADGQSLETNSNYTIPFKKLEILVNSMLNRMDTPDEELAIHNKHFLITVDGIDLEQRIEWLESITCGKSYMTMFPVARSINGINVSNKAIRDDDFEIEDLSEGHTRKWTQNTRKVSIWNDGEGHQFKANIEILTPSYLPKSDMFISESQSPRYNKVYYDYCGNGHVTEVGEEWRIRTKYSYDYAGIV